MSDQIARTAAAAASWWGERLGADYADKRTLLESALVVIIDNRLRERGRVCLENDYDPNEPLLKAVHAAGIECRGSFFSGDGIFPRKHELAVSPGRMEPKEGYGNWTDDIEVP